jgi:glycosyltransferase involved in cell wall biosynthesis
MRIAIDARELTGRPTGVGRYLAEVLAAWSALPAAGAHEFILCATERVVLSRPSLLKMTALVEPGRGTAWEQTMLPRLVREAAPDVLFAPGYTAPLLTTTPTVLVVHDVSFSAHPEWFSRREGVRRRVLTQLSARRAARVLTVSDFSKREIVKHLGVDQAKVEVIYHGATFLSDVDAAFSRRHAVGSARHPVVLFVGSLFERRHIPELIDGFGRVAARHPEARLEIVGDNRARPRVDVEALAQAAGAGGRVHAREYVSEPELSELYAHATAFVFLSDYEGFGMTPLEALASGVPIVVLDTEISRHRDLARDLRAGGDLRAQGRTGAGRSRARDGVVRHRRARPHPRSGAAAAGPLLVAGVRPSDAAGAACRPPGRLIWRASPSSSSRSTRGTKSTAACSRSPGTRRQSNTRS